MTVESRLSQVKIRQLSLRRPVLVEKTRTLKETVDAMRSSRYGCALVCDGGKLVGIFTERDLLNRVLGENVSYSSTVEKFMTPNPASLSLDDSVVDAMRLMQHGDYRNIPLADGDGSAVGVVTVRELIAYFAEHFPEEALNLPPDHDQSIMQAEGA